MDSYDRFMNVQGVLKRKYIKPPENPIKQKQELELLLQKRADQLNPLKRQVSQVSDDSRMSLGD